MLDRGEHGCPFVETKGYKMIDVQYFIFKLKIKVVEKFDRTLFL
jgi:hypothetical protein